MANSVELEGVTKSFGKKVAVDRLDLTVPEGSIYGFIGPNGSGKTTTLRLILRIFQPDAGRVVVLGADRGNVADQRLGYLPEERGLYKRMRVLDSIEYFAHLKGFYDCRDAARQWLERLDAASWANQRLDSLSKGMAQKIQFIVAVIARPQLLVLDEPFAGLDPVNLEALKEAVLSIRDEGTTVIFSTHDMGTAERLCDTVLMIFEGRKVLDGSLAEIQRSYPVRSVRLRLADGGELPGDLSGIGAASRDGAFHVLTLANGTPPQAVLRQVAASREVEHFEVVRPTLHDIFVDIARPPAGALESR
jgi:ABC-2 type transport system ATP-binding protein